jgi:site-specific DNA-methyltransferase (cytosine-N4-specific)
LGQKRHPARFPPDLPRFFIKFLTQEGDLVLDFFSGSNTTGAVAEELGRNWLSIELDRQYAILSAVRFMEDLTVEETKAKIREMGDGLAPMLHRTLLAPEKASAEPSAEREAVAAQLGLF